MVRARFFLAKAEALPGNEREAFENYLQAAIVFGRSAHQYLQSLGDPPDVDRGYRLWFKAKRTDMTADPVLGYFWNTRNLLVHERHVPVQRRMVKSQEVV